VSSAASDSRPQLGTEKYPALTGVRALGASVVFFDHFSPWPDSHIIINVLAFFYVLSGFLITRIYYEQLQLQRTWLWKYFVNRFARIYPVYFLILSVVVLLGHHADPATLVKNFTLTHALFHGTALLIPPSWSLTVEECFYFLAPVFLLLARRRGLVASFAFACVLAIAALCISRRQSEFLQSPMFVLTTTFFGHFVEFFAGVWLALTVLRLEKAGAVTTGRWRTAAGVLGVAVLIAAMAFVYRRPQLNVYAILLINNVLIPAPIALLYLGLIRESTLVSRVLSGPVAGLMGRGSYSFYLLHVPIIGYVSAHIPGVMSVRPLYVAATFVGTWLVALALFVLYEEPLNRLIRGRSRSKDRAVGMSGTLFRPGPTLPAARR
jgi:peptidoglycan/LPS O-acetylase OafA/YrhL